MADKNTPAPAPKAAAPVVAEMAVETVFEVVDNTDAAPVEEKAVTYEEVELLGGFTQVNAL